MLSKVLLGLKLLGILKVAELETLGFIKICSRSAPRGKDRLLTLYSFARYSHEVKIAELSVKVEALFFSVSSWSSSGPRIGNNEPACLL